MLRTHFWALLLCSILTTCYAEQPGSQNRPNLHELEKMSESMTQLQKMSDSMQRINALFSACKMQSECILASLREMATKEQDAVAKMILEEFEKQQKLTLETFEACFEQEKAEVMNALSHCDHSSPKAIAKESADCFESTLLSLVAQGNTFAEIALIQFYKSQDNPAKAAEWEQKIRETKNLNNDVLTKCLQEKK